MRTWMFWLVAAAVVACIFGLSRLVTNDYFFFAAYVVLQYVVMATAWNILGGYTGYVNFGTAGFYALGAYSSVVLHKLYAPPMVVLILAGGLVSGAIGLGMGYLTLRLRGVFFAIATLALAIVLETLITNWDYVGGSRGVSLTRPGGRRFSPTGIMSAVPAASTSSGRRRRRSFTAAISNTCSW